MKNIRLVLHSQPGGYQVDTSPANIVVITPQDLAILEMYFSEVDGASKFIDLAAHSYRHVGTPVTVENGEAVFTGSGMLMAPVVGFPGVITPPFTIVTGNDNYENRSNISGLPVRSRAENIGATGQPGEPNPFNTSPLTSIWWSWVSPTNGRVKIDTFGSSIDTQLIVYAGSTFSGLAEIAKNDDRDLAGNVRTAAVTIDVVAGQTYQIAVQGAAGQFGQIDLSIDSIYTGLTEWDFLSALSPQRLTFSIDFQIDADGVVHTSPQYLFDSRHKDFQTPGSHSLSIRYQYDSATPANSYLAFNLKDFQHDLTEPDPWLFRVPLLAVQDNRYHFDLVIFTDANNNIRATSYLNGLYYREVSVPLDWELDRFGIGGSLFTDATYPNIGDYPGFLNGQINEIVFKQGAYDTIKEFSHDLRTVLDLPLKDDLADLGDWDYQVVPSGSVQVGDGVAVFSGGYIQLQADKALIPDDFDWDLTLTLQVQPNQLSNAIVFCRPPTSNHENKSPDLYGRSMALLVSPVDHPGHLILLRGLSVNKGKFQIESASEIRSLSRIDDGLIHRIRIVRTNGSLDQQRDAAVSGTPPDYRGNPGSNAVRLYIDDLLQGEVLGRGTIRTSEDPDLFGTPIYFGALPPGLTYIDTSYANTGALNGNISKIKFSNRLPDAHRIVDLEFNERNGATSFLDLANHTWSNNTSNSIPVVAQSKKAVFVGQNYLSATPVGGEWSIQQAAHTFFVEWNFNSIQFADPGILEQYIYDARTSAASGMISVRYHRDPMNLSVARIKVDIGNSAINWSIPVPIELNRNYRIDILLFEKGAASYAAIAMDGSFYAAAQIFAGTISWTLAEMAIGTGLLTNGTYTTPGSYPGKLIGRVNRVGWLHGVFNPFRIASSEQKLILQLNFENDFQDTSEYAQQVTASGNVSIVDRQASFVTTSGGGVVTISHDPVLSFNTPDWQLDIEVDPIEFQAQTNAPIACRPELNTDTGKGWILTFGDPTYPGYLIFHDHFYLNTSTNQYATGIGSAPLLKSKQSLIGLSGFRKISVIKTTGVYDGSASTAMWLYIDGELHDMVLNPAIQLDPETPIYLGSIPPGSTDSVSGGTGSGKFGGKMNYVRLSNYVNPIYLLTTNDGRQFRTHTSAPILILQ